MGLAYDLKVDYWLGMGDYISRGLIDFASIDPQNLLFPEQSDFFWGFGWMYRFCGTAARGTQDSQAIFPTGEYIIRDITFINGYYITVGSYKAYFRDLYGAGNDGYAWDGFIMPIRGYSYNLNTTAPFLYNETTKAYEGINDSGIGNSGWGFMPMRMPLDIQPGLLADAAAVAADSSVGLQSVDIAKGKEGLEVGAQIAEDSANIKITTVGFQRVGDPVAQGMLYTNIDYIPFMWISQLGSYVSISPTSMVPFAFAEVQELPPSWLYRGGNPGSYSEDRDGTPLEGNIIYYLPERQSTLQVSWRANANYTLLLDGSLPPCENTRLYDLEDWVGASAFNTGGGADYQIENWNKGYNATGTNYLGVAPPLGVNSSSLFWDMLPRRWMGVTTYSEQAGFAGGAGFEQSGAFNIVGDMYLGGDGSVATPVTTATVPMVIGGLYNANNLSLDFCQLVPADKARQGPFMVMHGAGASLRGAGAGGASEWFFNATYDEVLSFDGAYAVECLIPYELMVFANQGIDNPSDRSPLRYFMVNDIEDASGDKGSAVFITEDVPQYPDIVIPCIFAPTQNPKPSTQGYPDMDIKWYSKLMQSRTFTENEEDRAKILNYESSTESPFADPATAQPPIYVKNANSGENVGVFGNYQRYGLDDDPRGDIASKNQQGKNSRQGYGGLSWSSSENEPVTYIFDSGRGWYKNTLYPVGNPNRANPPDYSNVVKNVGATFNSKILLGTNSATRKAVWAGWDNDRDQWLFLFSDTTNGISVVSANSTFTASSNNDAFLDQTDNFTRQTPLVGTFKTAMWNPFLMTNELDGMVIMGAGNKDNTAETIYGYTGDGAANSYWLYAYGPTTTTQTVNPTWGASPIGSTTIEYTPSQILTFIIKGTTGREAKVWVDYILFDGADALIATKLRERGMKVTIEAVEWFKRKIINSGDLNIKQEEIEEWMRQQQDEFQMMMRDAERMGRIRKKKSQVSAFGLDMLDSINTDFEDKEVQEFMKEYLPQSRPPTPEEQMIERQKKGGYSPQTKSYYDEVFEN